MTSGTLRSRLVACLLNVSEGRRSDLVEKVAKAALYDADGLQRKETTVLNIFSDQDYNRSVISIVASVESIGDAVLSACQEACALIDMRVHAGAHPCLGSVDLVPIYPLGGAVGQRDCVRQALAVARGLTASVRGASVVLFGWADAAQRSLVQRRKENRWFRTKPDLLALTADIGPPPRQRYGLTAVGSGPYVMNCNVSIDTQDVSVGRSVAAGLRASAPGGLPGVQVLALPHSGAVELACNVESVPMAAAAPGGPADPADPAWPRLVVDGRPYCHVPAALVAARAAELAARRGVGVKGAALVGFTPQECRGLAELALSEGIGEFWRDQRRIRM